MKKNILPYALLLLSFGWQASQAQWTSLGSGITATPRALGGIFPVNEDVIWGFTWHFTDFTPVHEFTRTTDGGQTWHPGTLAGVDADQFTINLFPLDDQIAWLATADEQDPISGHIYKTTNGGNTWAHQATAFTGTNETPAGVWFWNENDGFAYGATCYDNFNDQIAIYTTNDGGENWSEVVAPNMPAQLPGEGMCLWNFAGFFSVVEDTVWFGTSKGRIFRSTNKGLSWEVIGSPFPPTKVITSVAFKDGSTGIALGANPLAIVRSTDGGATWSPLAPTLLPGSVAAQVENIPGTKSTWMIVSSPTKYMVSYNDGDTWETHNSNIDAWSVDFLNAKTGFAGSYTTNPTTASAFKWSGPALGNRLFVNDDAAGANDGTSWADAFNDLQSALAIAEAGDEIWVAEGTYLPGSDPAATFLIDENLHLLGGFNGTETSADQRDPEVNITILSGDLNGDDVEDNFVTNRGDNVMTVVTVNSNITNETLIDGFTTEGGQADGLGTGSQTNGAGIYCLGAPAFRNCIFKQNFASLNGGGISLNHSVAEDVVFENCRFEKNWADYGGGVYIKPSQPIDHQTVSLIDCVFEKNKATIGHGGGVYYLPNGDSTTFAMTGCDFIGNKARLSGGGFAHWNPYNHYKALKMTIDSCHFSQDTIENDSGSAILLYSSARDMDFTLSNSTFEDNFTEAYGTVILWGTVGGTGVMTVENCLFENNRAGYSAGLDIGNDYDAGYYEYNVINCDFIGNEATDFCGGLDIWTYSSATIRVERCTMLENKAGTWGGGMMVWMHGLNASATVSNCVIENNESSFGAAIGTYPEFSEPWGPVNDSTTFINCLITGNIGEGATIATNPHGNLILLNCTVAENPAGGLLLDANSSLAMQNTILYNPGYTEYTAATPDVTFTSNGGNLIADNSITALLPSDIANGDPLFAAPGDYHLTDGSPCADAGNDDGVTATTDLDGAPRIQSLRVDMGAYESPFPNAVQEVVAGEVSVSPNPAASVLNVILPEANAGEIDLQVFDEQGRVVLLGTSQQLDVQALAPGMYSLRVVVGERVFAGKFIKQ